MRRLTLTSLLLVALTSSALPQSKSLNHLKSWADETPIDRRTKRSLFALPEVRQRFVKLLGRAAYAAMISKLDVTTGVSIYEGHLMVRGWTKNRVFNEDYLIVLRLADGAAYVGHAPRDGITSWRSSTGFRPDLPECLLQLHEPESARVSR